MAQITRAQAVELIGRQLRRQTEAHKAKAGAHNYGVCELRELLDAIYAGPPTGADEQLCSRHK